MFVRGVSADELRAILRIAPFNLLGAILLVIGGAAGGHAQTILWAVAAILLWLTPQFTSVEGFVVGVAHFVERHGLVVIIALGESIVVLGVGTEGLDIDADIVFFALLALALNAALWWLYFSDEGGVEHAFHAASAERRPQLALTAFGYWHYGLLLAVIAVAAGLKKAIAYPHEGLEHWIALALAAGTALYIACDAGFRRTFGLPRNTARLIAVLLALATFPLGTAVGGAAQVAALALIIAVAVVVRYPPAATTS